MLREKMEDRQRKRRSKTCPDYSEDDEMEIIDSRVSEDLYSLVVISGLISLRILKESRHWNTLAAYHAAIGSAYSLVFPS